MKDVITGELLAKLYLELDADEKAFFFNKIGSVLRTKMCAVEQMPDQNIIGGDGRKAIKSFTDPYFAARFDERSGSKNEEIPMSCSPPCHTLQKVLDYYKNAPNDLEE